MKRRRFFQRTIGSIAAALLAPLALKGVVAPSVAASPASDAWTALLPGDMFTIAGKYATNPATGKTVAGMLQNYVIVSQTGPSCLPAIDPVVLRTMVPKPITRRMLDDGFACRIEG